MIRQSHTSSHVIKTIMQSVPVPEGHKEDQLFRVLHLKEGVETSVMPQIVCAEPLILHLHRYVTLMLADLLVHSFTKFFSN